MEFNLVSKNNLGVVTALLLVIILSQGRFFNFLLDTALGRAILILFILFISYTNKILGVVSVLFIIIMFNNSNFGYMEGATTMGTTMPTTMPTTMGSMKKDDSKKPPTHMKKSVEGGSEGHNLPETERSFGKQSNSISATKTTSGEGFEPYSGSFKESYSQF